MTATTPTVKLFKTDDGYQSEPLCGSGIGRFQVRKTDNANARAVGRQPRWTVIDLYAAVGTYFSRTQVETLEEVREWVAYRLSDKFKSA